MSTPADESFESGSPDSLPPLEPIEERSSVAEEPTHAGNRDAPPSRARRIIKRFAWTGIVFGLLLFFTIMKFPDEQVRALIQAEIASAAADHGYTITSGSTVLSILTGPSYKMKDVTISNTQGNTLKVAEIGVAPNFPALLLLKNGASFWLKSVDAGLIKGSASWKGNSYSTAFTIKDLDLHKSGVPQALAQFSAAQLMQAPSAMGGSLAQSLAQFGIAGQLNGSGSVSGDSSTPLQTNGKIELKGAKLAIEQQTILGFSIPRISMSEVNIEMIIEKGKVQLKTFQLGKPGTPTDDIQGTLSGDITLGMPIETSSLNLKTKFGVSENILKSFVLFDSFFGGFKQPDGQYQFLIRGSLGLPSTAPVTP